MKNIITLLIIISLMAGCTVPVLIGAHVAGYAVAQGSASGKAKVTKVDESIYDINVRHNSLKNEEEIYEQLVIEAKTVCKNKSPEYISRNVNKNPIYGNYGEARIRCN